MEAMSFNGNQRTVMFASSDRGLSSARSYSDCVASNLPAKTDWGGGVVWSGGGVRGFD